MNFFGSVRATVSGCHGLVEDDIRECNNTKQSLSQLR